MTKELFVKIGDALASKELEAKLNSCNSEDEILSLLKENNVDITPDELKEFLSMAKKCMNDSEELDDDELENVAGGGLFTWIRNTINQVKNDWNKIKNGFGYVFGGQYVIDVAEGRRNPW